MAVIRPAYALAPDVMPIRQASCAPIASAVAFPVEPQAADQVARPGAGVVHVAELHLTRFTSDDLPPETGLDNDLRTRTAEELPVDLTRGLRS